MRLVSITRAAMVARCLQVAVAMGLCMPSDGNCVSDACPSPQDVVADGGPLSDEAAALLQHGIRGSDGLGGSSGGSRQAAERVGWLTKGLPFKEPPKIRSPFTLTMSTVQLCAPGKGALGGEQCWCTRAYGATHGRIKIAPSVPGPTIFVKPGETPEITLQNDLRWPDPECGAVQLPGQCVCTCHARGAPHLQNRPSRLPHGRHPLVSPPQPPLSGRAGRWWLFRIYHRGRPQRRVTKGVRGHGREGRHDKLDRWELDYQCQWCVRPASSGTNGDGPFVEVTWEVCELPGYCRAGQRSVQAEDDDRRQQQVVPLSNGVRLRRARAVYLPLVQ
mmetsp:Transcript_37827/g.121671  ORF Transcript_37827/g.121671 Transcript_37827/m.121671 type:complete len:332 (+) Transcript_37827:37-1032(+)